MTGTSLDQRPPAEATNMDGDHVNGNTIGDWWVALSDAAQQRLRQRPYDPVPEHLMNEVVRGALLTTGTYWPATYPPNPAQFRIPPEVASWIRDNGN